MLFRPHSKHKNIIVAVTGGGSKVCRLHHRERITMEASMRLCFVLLFINLKYSNSEREPWIQLLGQLFGWEPVDNAISVINNVQMKDDKQELIPAWLVNKEIQSGVSSIDSEDNIILTNFLTEVYHGRKDLTSTPLLRLNSEILTILLTALWGATPGDTTYDQMVYNSAKTLNEKLKDKLVGVLSL